MADEMMMEGSEATEAPMEGALTSDYISETIGGAVDNIPDSKYLDEEEGEEPKKTVPDKKGDKKAPSKAKPEEVSEEEPPEEEEEEEVPEETEAKEAKTNAKWKQYRDAFKESVKLKAELSDLKRKLETAGDTRELESLRQAVQQFQQERGHLMRAIEVGNIEASPHWHQHVTQPLNRMWEQAQTIAKRNELDPNTLVNFLVNRDDVGLNEYMAEARPGDKYHAFQMIRDLDQIEYTKNHLRQNAAQMRQSDQAQFSAQRQAQMRQVGQARHTAIQKIMPKIEEKVMRFIPKDKRMDLGAQVKHIMDSDRWSDDVKMYAGMAALVLPDVLDSWKSSRLALKAAKEELVKMRGGTPKVNAGASGSPRRAQIETDEEEDAEIQKPIREFAMGAAKRIQAAAGLRSR